MYNWTHWTSSPFMESLRPFTDLLGYGFFLIPISVIGAALWQQKKDLTAVTLYFTASFTILAGGTGAVSIFGDYLEILPLYIVLAAIGWTALIVQTVFIRR
jgi:hypothetical protein